MTKSINHLFVICACSLTLSACLSSNTSLSTMRMDRPEVSANKYALTTQFGLGGRKTVDLSTPSGYRSIQPPTFASTFEESVDIAPAISIGITPIPMLEVSISSLDDVKISIKYQFNGESADTATKGNFSQAFSIGLSAYDEKRSFGNYSFETTDYSSNPVASEFTETSNTFKQDTYAIDAAWILGYRLTNNILIYGGPFYIYGDLSGEQNFTIRRADNAQLTNGSEEQTLLSLDSSGSMLGANLAVEYKFDFGLFLTAEATLNRMEWEGASDTSANAGLIIGYQF